MTLNWGEYAVEQAEIQRRDDIEFYRRHKSPPKPSEAEQVHPAWVDGAVMDMMNFEQECCGGMIPDTADCWLGGICPLFFNAKEMLQNGHSY